MGYVEELRAVVGTRPLILTGSVVLVLDAEGRLLLQRRSESLWALPGGLMELGESAEDTARREVREETGLELETLQLLDVFSGPEFYLRLKNGDEFYSVTVAYTSRSVPGDLRVDGVETLEARYFPLEALPEGLAKKHRRIIDRLKAGPSAQTQGTPLR